jgi:formylglycine-generating enzyme required for sulfatase activity
LNRLIEIFGQDDMCRLDETSLPLLIGMDETAHVRIDGAMGIVAYVAESRNHLFLQPAVDTATLLYHNDEPVDTSVWLKSGDITRIGDVIIRWYLSGQRVEIHIAKASTMVLRPPVEPPIKPKDLGEEQILPVLEAPRPDGSRFRTLALIFFALLLCGAAFVLLANPLAVIVAPAPDSLSVSGFPPAVKFGDRYLGLSGRYTLHAEKQGYLPLEEEIEITSAGSRYSFTLEKLPGLVDLTSTPGAATVLVDGVPVGETPLQGVKIPAGRRTVRFQHERYQELERTVEIEGFGARQSLQVELEPAWAMVALQTEPQGATLRVDGEERGVTPLKLELVAGKHQLVFSKEKFSALEVELAVTAGQDLAPAVYRLEPASASVAITSVPVGSTVTVDGVYKGLTPLTILLQSAKEHDLRLTLTGHLPASRRVKLEPEEQRQLDIRLEPEYGTVFIAATPAEATLLIDGKKQSLTNGRFRLTTRAHSLELKANGYESLRSTVTPQPGYSQRVELELRRTQADKHTQPFAGSAPTSPTPGKTTTLGQKLVLIAPQPFMMGASRQEAGRRANESEREVAMGRSFFLSEREVSNAEYKRFRPDHTSGMSGNRSLEDDSHPVVNVSWEDAARFLNWLSQKDGLPPFYREEQGTMVSGEEKGFGYRLPTEAEWAYAARMAGQKARVRYPWPGKYPPTIKAGNFADESARHLLPVVIEGYTDGFPATAPTGSFPANPVGLYDLGGNVAEWCHDYYAANPAGGKSAVDPMGPSRGTHRVVRGSSWRDASITELRFSYRRYSREPANDIGFRIARYAR